MRVIQGKRRFCAIPDERRMLAIYHEILKEPIPERFKKLLERLEREAERDQGGVPEPPKPTEPGAGKQT